MENKTNKINCRRCNKLINLKDNYCRLTEWKKGKFFTEGYYHNNCFREGIHGTKEQREITKQAKEFMNKASSFFNQDKKGVYEII